MESETRDNGLARDMGALGAIATVIAGTLGAGLFVTIGTASSTTGPSVILVVIATGIVAMAIATNYSWMATIFPGAGGLYTYISRTFSARWAGFVVTWTKWLGYMAADAVLAIGFGSYLKVFFPAVDPPIAGFCLLTVLFLVNLVGTKSYSRSQNVIFVLLILSVLVLVIPGLFYIQPAHYRPFFTGGPSGFFAAAVPLFYAYIGIAVAAQMGAEVRNPGRNLPLAMAGGTAFLIVVYVLTAAVIYGIVGDYTVLANSDRPLATAAASFLGEYTTGIVAVGGLLATAAHVYIKRPDLCAAAAFKPGAWFYIPLAIGALGSAALITQAANWRALFTGDFGALSTLAVYIPWLALGLVIFGVYTYRDKQRGIDVDAILRTVPGVAESRASANGARS